MRPVNGRYRVLEEVGRGGMSIVWRGHDDVLDRPVAIKALASGYADDQAFRDRIRREARAAARLSHPHVGAVYDFGEAADGRPYMVMELIEGESLADRLRRAPLPPARVLTIAAQVASALAETHARGLLHRDVKPGNVMLTPSGAKLVDFGISAMVGDETGQDGPDLPGMLLGTPAYVAPEVVTGAPAGAAADVYALGILFYRALTGHLPWPVDTPSQVLRAHVFDEPRPLPPIEGLPAEVAELSLRCLSKDPADRPGCAELAAAWSSAARTATGTVESTSLVQTTMRLPDLRGAARRHRRAAVLAFAVFGLAAVGATAAFSPSPSRTDLAAPAGRAAAAPRQSPPPPKTCQVVYRLRSDDGHRFSGAVTVRNTGSTAVPASTLTFAFPGTQRLDGATFAQHGPTVTVPVSSLAPGGTGSYAFSGRYQGVNAMPTGFTLGATTCDAQAVGVTARPAAAGAGPTATHGASGGESDDHGKAPKPPKPKKSHKN